MPRFIYTPKYAEAADFNNEWEFIKKNPDGTALLEAVVRLMRRSGITKEGADRVWQVAMDGGKEVKKTHFVTILRGLFVEQLNKEFSSEELPYFEQGGRPPPCFEEGPCGMPRFWDDAGTLEKLKSWSPKIFYTPSPDELVIFDQLWEHVNPSKQVVADTATVVGLLNKSGLSGDQLNRVWMGSTYGGNTIQKEHFNTLMGAIALEQNGVPFSNEMLRAVKPTYTGVPYFNGIELTVPAENNVKPAVALAATAATTAKTTKAQGEDNAPPSTTADVQATAAEVEALARLATPSVIVKKAMPVSPASQGSYPANVVVPIENTQPGKPIENTEPGKPIENTEPGKPTVRERASKIYDKRDECLNSCCSSIVRFWPCYGLLAIVVFVLIFLSVNRVHYYELGLLRNRLEGTIDRTRVYLPGLYFLGPSSYFVKYPSNSQTLHIRDLQIWSQAGSGPGSAPGLDGEVGAAGAELTMDVMVVYHIPAERLPGLNEKVGNQFGPYVKNIVLNGIKNAATKFSVDRYTQERGKVENEFLEWLRPEAAEKAGINVTNFMMLQVQFKDSFYARKLMSAMQIQKSYTEEYLQQTALVRGDTAIMVKRIENEAGKVIAEAKSQAELKISNATSQAGKILINSIQKGLGMVADAMNITEEKDLMSLHYLMNLADNPFAIRKFVNFNDMPEATSLL